MLVHLILGLTMKIYQGIFATVTVILLLGSNLHLEW